MTVPERARPARRLQGLERWLEDWAKATGTTGGRLRRQLGVAVVAGMLDAVRDEAGRHRFVIKGGSALELRFGLRARSSRDLDSIYRGVTAEAAIEAEAAVTKEWQGFTGIVARVETVEVPGLAVPPIRFDVRLSYRGDPFATVPMEVSGPEGAAVEGEDLVVAPSLAPVGLEGPDVVPCLSLAYQIAQKLHACTDPLDGIRPNDRARDLADILLIEELAADRLEFGELAAACADIFSARDRHPWPPELVVHDHWADLWARIVEDDGFPITDVQEAAGLVRDLIGRIDAVRS